MGGVAVPQGGQVGGGAQQVGRHAGHVGGRAAVAGGGGGPRARAAQRGRRARAHATRTYPQPYRLVTVAQGCYTHTHGPRAAILCDWSLVRISYYSLFDSNFKVVLRIIVPSTLR